MADPAQMRLSGVIGEDLARTRCTIQSCETIAGRTVIGDDVTIGPRARVFPDVRIDADCHLGANAGLAGLR